MARFTQLLLACLLLMVGCERKDRAPATAKTEASTRATAEARLAAVKAPPPPEPGRAQLTFSGALSVRVDGEGTTCHDDGGFSVLSSDIQGFGTSPEWSFIRLRDRAHFNVGPLGKEERYTADIPAKSTAIVRRGDTYTVDLELTAAGSGKAVRVVGSVGCPSAATVNLVPEPVVALLRDAAQAEVRRFSDYDFGRAKDVRSISAIVAKSAAQSMLSVVRRKLPPGFVAFIGTTQWLGDQRHEGVELVVGPARDQFDILRLAHTDAVNYDLTTEALVKKLRDIHSVNPIDIFQAETDTIQFRLLRPPSDARALAKDLYEFCPDAVDQGVGTLEALEKTVVNDQVVYLWWD